MMNTIIMNWFGWKCDGVTAIKIAYDNRSTCAFFFALFLLQRQFGWSQSCAACHSIVFSVHRMHSTSGRSFDLNKSFFIFIIHFCTFHYCTWNVVRRNLLAQIKNVIQIWMHYRRIHEWFFSRFKINANSFRNDWNSCILLLSNIMSKFTRPIYWRIQKHLITFSFNYDQ